MNRELQLQHDVYNSLDRLRDELTRLELFNRQMSIFCKENNVKLPNQTRPYITAEYIKTHIQTVSRALDNFYLSKQNNENT